MMLARGLNPVENRGLVSGALAAMMLTIAVMSITRHQVRILYLDPVASQYQLQVVPQWGNFALFVMLLLIGLATVAYMVKRVVESPASPEEAA
jgi:hypothetical protein